MVEFLKKKKKLKTLILLKNNQSIPQCLVGRVFTNGPEDLGSIPGRVIPKTQKNGT